MVDYPCAASCPSSASRDFASRDAIECRQPLSASHDAIHAQAAIVEWLGGAGGRDEAVAMLELAGEDGVAARPEPEQRARAAALLDALAAPYLRAAAAVRAGLRPEFAARVVEEEAEAVSRLIQVRYRTGSDDSPFADRGTLKETR